MAHLTSQAARAAKRNKKNEALWLMSFSDMSLILLSFFLLLLSMSKIDASRYDSMSDSLSSKDQKGTQNNLDTLAEKLNAEIKEKKLEGSAGVVLDMDGLRVEFRNHLLFLPGSADPVPEFAAQTSQIMKIIAGAHDKYQMTIEGHTDDTPLAGSKKYIDNWELSAHRGFAILKALRGEGVQESRMRVLALAHVKPKLPVLGLEGKQLEKARAVNRRVVVHIR